MKARLVYVMEDWGAAAICEGWSTFFFVAFSRVDRG